MEDLTKKLSMKKTFFVTQLESFFSSITTEFTQKLSSYEVENRVLKQENEKLSYDVENLVKIKDSLTNQLEEKILETKELKKELIYVKEVSTDEQNLELIRENNRLKTTISTQQSELDSLNQKIKTLQNFASKGANPYNQSILEKKNEEIVKEITENLKK